MNKMDMMKELKRLSRERSKIMGRFEGDMRKNTDAMLHTLMEFEENSP